MKRLIIAGVIVAVMGGAGFAAGRFLAPPEPVEMPATDPSEILYKLPLGRFTVQVLKPERFFNIRFNMDVFITGAANFEKMNGGISRGRMREDVILHLSNMVETTLWVQESRETEIDQDELALAIARKLYQTYPMVRSALISDFVTSRVSR